MALTFDTAHRARLLATSRDACFRSREVEKVCASERGELLENVYAELKERDNKINPRLSMYLHTVHDYDSLPFKAHTHTQVHKCVI